MKIYTKEMIQEKNKKKKVIKNIINFIVKPVFMIIFILCIYIAYQKIVEKKQSIDIFGYKFYVVLTGSMKPEINPNDIVIVKKEPQDSINVGDTITFFVPNNTETTITHRIIEIIEKDGRKYYKTKGDNNNTEDSDLILYENIQGVYKFKIPGIGVILTGGFTGIGFIVFFLFIVISYHRAIKNEDRMLTREEARKKYNIYKYKDGEKKDDTI